MVVKRLCSECKKVRTRNEMCYKCEIRSPFKFVNRSSGWTKKKYEN